MEERISIIVPVYNVAQYLARCLYSLVNQTYKNLEILLVDDGSTDDSAFIAGQYEKKDARIRLFRQENKGISGARNTALDCATGEWIMFADSDDYLEPNAVERLYGEVRQNKVRMAVAGHFVCYGDSKKAVHIEPALLDTTEKLQEYFIRSGRNHSFAWSKLYHREVFQKLRYPEGKIYEDIRILPFLLEAAGSGVVIDEPLYNYCLRRESVTYQSDIDKQYQGLEACLASQKFYQKHYPQLTDGASAQIVDYCCYLMGRICRAGRSEHPDYWKNTVRTMKKTIAQAYPCGRIYRILSVLVRISPGLLGKLFQFYSAWKNGFISG